MNNVPLNLYKIFYYVAINKNITKTAKLLYVSQPSITQAIKKLEEILGVQLIVRTKKGIFLTNEGEILFNYVKISMEAIFNAEQRMIEMKNMKYGTIRVGASYSLTKFFLLPLIEKFHQKYPNIKIQIINGNTKESLKALKTNAIDIIVLNLPQENDADLNYIKKIEVHDCFVASTKYFDNLIGKKLTLAELNKYPIILKNQNSNTRKFLDIHCAANNVLLYPKYEVTSHWLLTDFVKIGYGIGHLTKEFVLNELESKEFFELDITPKIKTRYVGIALLKDMPYTDYLRNFIEILNEK